MNKQRDADRNLQNRDRHPAITPGRYPPTRLRLGIDSLVLVLVLGVGLVEAAREIKPGWNLFSRQQDIQLGREAAEEIEKEVQIVRDPELTQYVANLGGRLASPSQDQDYPYSFQVVADSSINAFALPGGPIYIHTGTIAAAENEAQLAGVIAHEIAHVALRHSTHQMSKRKAWQIPLALAATALDQKSGMLAALGKMGIHFGANSLFLRYSRDAEKDADIVGARMMVSAGYDPIEMARFFMKLEEKSQGQRWQFFSDHPSPGNRVEYVKEEVHQLPSEIDTVKGSPAFDRMQVRAAGIQAERAKSEPGTSSDAKGTSTAAGLPTYQGSRYRLSYPRHWRVFAAGDGTAVTILPKGGIVDRGGSPALARGIIAGYFHSDTSGLQEGTDQVIRDLKASSPELQPLPGKRMRHTLSGQRAERILLEGPGSLREQREFIYLVTTQRPEGFFYLVLVLPQNEYKHLQALFQEILDSFRFH